MSVAGRNAERERAEAEAAERFSLLRSGAANQVDLDEIEAWRASAECNETAWNRMSAIWAGSAASANSPEIQAMRSAALARNVRSSSRSANWRPFAIAASLVAMIGTGMWIGGSHMPWTKTGDGVAIADSTLWSAETRTQVGQIRSLALNDGSVVTINTDSSLHTTITATERRVQLSRGEAYFKVAKDRDRPFSVRTRNIVVTALGTAFSVRNTGDTSLVTLVEGQVSVEAVGRPEKIVLTPGSQLRVDASGFHRVSIDARRAIMWTSKMLSFERAPLGAAIAEANRYSKRRIILADGDLRTLPISGLFPIADQDRFIDMLVATGKVRVGRRTASRIELAAP